MEDNELNLEIASELLSMTGVEVDMAENGLQAAERFAHLGRAVGAAGAEDTDLEAAEKFIRACRELCSFCHIPTPEEFGIDREEFLEKIPKMTQDALASGSPANTRKELNAEDITVMYKSLLS